MEEADLHQKRDANPIMRDVDVSNRRYLENDCSYHHADNDGNDKYDDT